MSTLALWSRPYQNPSEGSYILEDPLPESSYILSNVRTVASGVAGSIVAPAMERIGTLCDPRMKSEAAGIVEQFRAAAEDASLDPKAPPLRVLEPEDGSILIEWQMQDRTLGFCIEPTKGQSGWYYACSRESGGQCGAGLLASLDMKALFRLMQGKVSL